MIEGRYQNISIDGLSLRLFDAGGSGFPVVFQHGLCGDSRQTREAFPRDPRFRLITLECRGHGESKAGDPLQFSLQTFMRDVQAVIAGLGLGRYAIGGISMGAAIATKVAALAPQGLAGAMIVRPAWDAGAPVATLRPNVLVGQLIEAFGASGRDIFKQSSTYTHLAKSAPDNLASLEGFFAREPQAVTSELLQRIATDRLDISTRDLQAFNLPTLVIGHDRDEVHPIAVARSLAAAIPKARFKEITPKATDKSRYLTDMHAALTQFLETLL